MFPYFPCRKTLYNRKHKLVGLVDLGEGHDVMRKLSGIHIYYHECHLLPEQIMAGILVDHNMVSFAIVRYQSEYLHAVRLTHEIASASGMTCNIQLCYT